MGSCQASILRGTPTSNLHELWLRVGLHFLLLILPMAWPKGGLSKATAGDFLLVSWKEANSGRWTKMSTRSPTSTRSAGEASMILEIGEVKVTALMMRKKKDQMTLQSGA